MAFDLRMVVSAALVCIAVSSSAGAQTKIKGLRPEGYGLSTTDTQLVISSGHADHVGIGLIWEHWQPTITVNGVNTHYSPPCPSDYVEWSSGCYHVPGVMGESVGNRYLDDVIRDYTAAGISVTALVFGTPLWAASPNCSQYRADCSYTGPNHAPCSGAQRWCAPNAASYAQFVRFLAARYDGTHGVGKVDNFVIENEVNSAMWYDVGCTGPHGSFVPCMSDPGWLNLWAHSYADVYNQAYDAIVAQQPNAHVLIPLTQNFAQTQSEITFRTFDEAAPSFTTAATLSGNTHDNQWLIQSWQPGFAGVRQVQIKTSASSSWVAWREIQALDSTSANVALGKPAVVSGNSAERQLAVDGNTTTTWNSGANAPQWITIDLGAPYTISQVKMLTNQNPAGNTVHAIVFGTTQYTVPYPHLSVQAFLAMLVPLISPASHPRDWRITMHPYNIGLNTSFSPEDYPYATMGDIGSVLGWLRQTYGNVAAAREMHLGESGYPSSGGQWTEAQQSSQVCDSLRNALGTPGIVEYLYMPLPDEPDFPYGLLRADKSPKPAWTKWAGANGPSRSCGYEVLPYTQLDRFYNGGTHWQSTRVPAPPGFTREGTMALLLRESAPNTQLLYECRVANPLHNYITASPSCGSDRPMGPVGYAYLTQVPGTVPLVRCSINGNDHFVSPGAGACGNFTFEATLGYVVTP